jgi:putative nucleotidyltransferase with HDIG domain
MKKFNCEEEKSALVLFVSEDGYVLCSAERTFSCSGIRFLHTDNAQEALDIITREKIAVIIADNYLPETRGIDLLSKVTNLSAGTMKILITSDADLTAAVDAIYSCGVSRVIMKPWTGDELYQNVKEVIIQYHISQSLKKENRDTLMSIAQAVEMKDLYTLGHSRRVAAYALMLARASGLSYEITKDIKYGGLLHDIGKIHIPEHILNKLGPLTNEDHTVLRNHPGWGAKVAGHLNLSQPIINIIRHHHERYDGKGYPSRIKGQDIPLETRIVTIADVYDALTSDRQYRSSYSQDDALTIMKSMNGNELDPGLLEVFIDQCLKTGAIQSSYAEHDIFHGSDKLVETLGDVRIISGG